MLYLGESEQATSVNAALAGDWLGTGETSLLQVKSNHVQVHSLAPTGLKLAVDAPIFGTVAQAARIHLRTSSSSSSTCALACLTTDNVLSVLSFNGGKATTLATQNVSERSAVRSTECTALLAYDEPLPVTESAVEAGEPSGGATSLVTKFLVVHAFQGLVRVIVLDEDNTSAGKASSARRASRSVGQSGNAKEDVATIDLSKGFTCRIQELLINSVLVLPHQANVPPRLATVHTDIAGSRVLQIHTLNLASKALEAEDPDRSTAFLPSTGTVFADPDSELLIPVQTDRLNGLIIVGQETARFVHTSAGGSAPRRDSKRSGVLAGDIQEDPTSEMALDEMQVSSPPLGKGKGRAIASPIDTNIELASSPPSMLSPTTPSARRRSSAASQTVQPGATSPPSLGNKRKLSESANSSGRGPKTPLRSSAGDKVQKIVECRLPVSKYTAYCALAADPTRFLLVDDWGHAMYLRVQVSSGRRRSSVSTALASTGGDGEITSPTTPSSALPPRPRRTSRSSFSGSGGSASSLPNVKLLVEPIPNGKVSSPMALVDLGEGYVFVGSHMGDSLLVKLPPRKGAVSTTAAVPAGEEMAVDAQQEEGVAEEMEIVNAYTNLAPIVDFCVVQSDTQGGPSHLVTCSGGRADGTLRVIRHGVGLSELASLDVEGVQRVWALSDKLVLSYVNETRVLAFSTGGKADGMDEQDEEDDGGIEELGAHDGFDLSRPTLLAFQTESGQVGQVTAQGITTFTGVQWSPPDGRKITLASSAGPYVLVALAGGEVILLHTSEGLVVQGQQNMQNEVACLDISSLDTSDGGKAYIASAGLWNEYAVVTMSVPALEVTDTIKLDTTFLLRSVLAITLSAPAEGSSSNEPGNPSSSGNYLFVGLGDGSLVSYALNGSANPSKPFKVSPESRKTLSLGSRPVTMTRIETGGAVPGGGEESVQRQAAPAVFVTSDRSTIVNAENGKLSYASVNTKDVTSVAGFSNAAYPSALVLATPSALTIGRIDSLQKLHVRTLRLGDEAPRRICYSRALRAYGAVFLREALDRSTGEVSRSSSFKILDENSFDVLFDYPLERGEEGRSVSCQSFGSSAGEKGDVGGAVERFIVGTGYINPDEEEASRGRVLLFENEGEGEFGLSCEAETSGVVHALAPLCSKESASSSSPASNYFAASSNSEIIVYAYHAPSSPRLARLEHVSSWGGMFICYSLSARNDLLCAVDPLRSAALLRFDFERRELVEVAKEWSAYGLFAAAFMDSEDDAGDSGAEKKNGEEEVTLLAADLDLNLFTAKKIREGTTATRHNMRTRQGADDSAAGTSSAGQVLLKQQAVTHLGDIVNKFCPGSLVPSFSSASAGAARPQLIYATSVGSIGMVASLEKEAGQVLYQVERNMRKVVGKGLGGLKQEDFRAFKTEYASTPSLGFIDGSFVEQLTELDPEQLEAVMSGAGNQHERIVLGSASAGEGGDAESARKTKEEVIRLVEELQRIH